MPQRWVVGVDRSENAASALRWAVTNARNRDVTVVALHAWHLPVTLASLFAKRGLDVDRMGLAAIAGHELDEAIGQLGDHDIEIEPLVIDGHPAEALVDRSGPSSLLIVGRRGAGGLRHLVVGSVSRYCATHADGPVIVVPPAWEPSPSTEIVTGFDGSGNSREALRFALEFAEAGTTVRALAAIDIAPGLDETTTRKRYPGEVAAETARLNERLDEADPEGRAVRSIVLQSAHQALSEASSNAALVVVGARGRRRRGGRLLGSVSTWLLHGTPCPVAVVPPPSAISDP